MAQLSTQDIAHQQDHWRRVVNDALDYAKTTAVDAAQMSLYIETGFSVNARQGDVETLEHHQEKGLSITVYLDQKTASVNTSDLSAAAIRVAVDKAANIAVYSNQDPFAGLADAEMMAKDVVDLQLFHPWSLTPSQAIERAIECERIALEQDARIQHCDSASVSTYNTLMVYGNTHGFIGAYPASSHSMSCCLVAEQDNSMQRDYEYTCARRADTLDDVSVVAKHAAQKTLARLGARSIATRQCPVVFHAPVAKSLLGHFVSAISGSNLYRKTSFLQDSLGQSIFPKQVQIYQQPHLLAEMGSAAFDAEGVTTRDLGYVTDGVVSSYILGSYSARKLGLKTTGNSDGVHNLEINHQGIDFHALLKTMDTGLLVTELIGQGVNILTGDYSRGISGFWVEKGEIQYPVEQVTIAGNLKDMFAHLVKVANDTDCRSSIRTGSILISEMTVSGESS